jgi:hypothetical protein
MDERARYRFASGCADLALSYFPDASQALQQSAKVAGRYGRGKASRADLAKANASACEALNAIQPIAEAKIEECDRFEAPSE